MPRRKNQKKLKKTRHRNYNSRPINDIRHNDSNITVNFRKVLSLTLIPSPGGVNTTYRALRLAPGISQLTNDLGMIYKLYRFTSVRFTFQAEISQNIISDVAINYIPAQESLSGQPTSLDEFEGPAVGFYANARGAPYTYTTPSKILNAMPYNWYETKAGEASDLTQGVFYFLSNVPTTQTINVLCHFTCEFQTLEDPAFLASLDKKEANQGRLSEIRSVRKLRSMDPKLLVEEQEEDYVRAESIYNERIGRSAN
jgi:hypothetical protein